MSPRPHWLRGYRNEREAALDELAIDRTRQAWEPEQPREQFPWLPAAILLVVLGVAFAPMVGEWLR